MSFVKISAFYKSFDSKNLLFTLIKIRNNILKSTTILLFVNKKIFIKNQEFFFY